MKFVAIIDYVPDADLVNRVRPDHRAYCATLKSKGQLAASGPFTDKAGALIIYEANSQEAAEQLLKADPFHVAGVFQKWVLRPWTIANASRESFPD
jgi:uncharacterized protein YciI